GFAVWRWPTSTRTSPCASIAPPGSTSRVPPCCGSTVAAQSWAAPHKRIDSAASWPTSPTSTSWRWATRWRPRNRIPRPPPTPLEDCYAALRWLAGQPWVDSTRIAVGGASAGGGFSAAAAQLARDRDDVKLRLQMLVYPMLDDRTGAQGGRRRVMWSGLDNEL